MTLGLEIRDSAAAAIAVDAAGVIAARALVESTGDLATAAVEAVDAVAANVGSGPLGIAAAAFDSDASSLDAVVSSLKRGYAGSFVQHGVMSAGIAAAVGERWAAAARGADNVVFLAAGAHVIAGVLREGAPMVGAGSRAASIAWLALNPVEREDYRKIGCLEA